jgi:hypothetical protein
MYHVLARSKPQQAGDDGLLNSAKQCCLVSANSRDVAGLSQAAHLSLCALLLLPLLLVPLRRPPPLLLLLLLSHRTTQRFWLPKECPERKLSHTCGRF